MGSRVNRKIAEKKEAEKTACKTMIFDKPHVPDTSTMRDYQKECLSAIENAGPGSHLCVLATGLGKCFAPGTRVMMYDGSVKNIEDIKEKEQVMGPDGNPRLVIGLTHGFDNMYTVHQNKGMDYTVNSVHILSLKRQSDGKTVNIEIKEYLSLSKEESVDLKGWKSVNGNIEYTDIQIELTNNYGEYYGFELVGPDRLFLLEDFTVVHNTYIFSHLPRYGRVLLLSHRDELVHQPEKYYDCSFGVEQAGEHSNGEEVVSASVQTLIRRLDKFDPYDFDMIITDEAHHAVAKSYQKIYDYFKPRVHIGFTATPDRADKSDLSKIYSDIIYYKDIKFGIKRNYLCDVDCLRVNIGYDLRHVHKQMGDFKQDELGSAMEQPEVVDAIAEAYNKYAKGATMIFAVNVAHAEKIAEKIDGAVVVTGKTPNRGEIIKEFTERKIPCIVNCMVFTEGTDIPLIETIIMARPTSNHSLYSQMVGRGLRLYPGKETLRLIDCVGVTGRLDICTAPNLFGLGTDMVDDNDKEKIQGRLSNMENILEDIMDTPKSWIINAERVNLISKEEGVNINNINYILMPDMSLHLSTGDGINIVIPQSDARGQTIARIFRGSTLLHEHYPDDKQTILNDVDDYLNTYRAGSRQLWDKTASTWGGNPSTEKQMNYIKTLLKQAGRPWDQSLVKTTKREAGIVIERLQYEIANKGQKNRI